MVAYAYQQAIPQVDDDDDRYEEGGGITWPDLIDQYDNYLPYRKRSEKHGYDTKNSLTHAADWFMLLGISPTGVNRRNARLVMVQR